MARITLITVSIIAGLLATFSISEYLGYSSLIHSIQRLKQSYEFALYSRTFSVSSFNTDRIKIDVTFSYPGYAIPQNCPSSVCTVIDGQKWGRVISENGDCLYNNHFARDYYCRPSGSFPDPNPLNHRTYPKTRKQ